MQINGNALEGEDAIFLHANFMQAFLQYMRARGLDASTMTKSDRQAASGIAVEEALRATYRDSSDLANWLNKGRQLKGIGFLVEGVMPFTKTPINVAKRSIEYSPIGIIQGAVKAVQAYTNGKCTKAEAIDRMSSGLTGTGLMALGYFLAQSGILRSKGKDDSKEEAYLEATGTQQYSINVGDVSMDMSFAAPTSVPMFMGAALFEALKGELSLSTLLEIAGDSLDPLMEMSFLSSVNSALQSYNTDNIGGALGAVGANVLKSYIGQFLPTVGAKVANVVDPINRSAKGDKTSVLGATTDSFLRSNAKKIPGLTYLLEPSIDVKGEQTTQYDFGSWALDFANSFVLPGRINVVNRDRTDNVLIHLYEQTGRTDILPAVPSTKYLTYKGARYTFDAKQYTQYCEDYGKETYIAIKRVMASDGWRNMTDVEKCDAIADAMEESQKQTKTRWLEKFGALD